MKNINLIIVLGIIATLMSCNNKKPAGESDTLSSGTIKIAVDETLNLLLKRNCKFFQQ